MSTLQSDGKLNGGKNRNGIFSVFKRIILTLSCNGSKILKAAWNIQPIILHCIFVYIQSFIQETFTKTELWYFSVWQFRTLTRVKDSALSRCRYSTSITTPGEKCQRKIHIVQVCESRNSKRRVAFVVSDIPGRRGGSMAVPDIHSVPATPCIAPGETSQHNSLGKLWLFGRGSSFC